MINPVLAVTIIAGAFVIGMIGGTLLFNRHWNKKMEKLRLDAATARAKAVMGEDE